MMIAIRIISLLAGLLALYMTYVYFKRKTFNILELGFWGITWLGVIGLSAAPERVYASLKSLNVDVVNFIYVVSIIALYVVCFGLYTRTKVLNEKVESVVRKIALRDAGLDAVK